MQLQQSAIRSQHSVHYLKAGIFHDRLGLQNERHKMKDAKEGHPYEGQLMNLLRSFRWRILFGAFLWTLGLVPVVHFLFAMGGLRARLRLPA